MAGVVAIVFVVVHNTASLPEAVLNDAKRAVQRIYEEAGVTIAWNPPSEATGFIIHVMIRRQPGGGPGAGSPSAAATTLRNDDARGGVSLVFYQRVLNLAHRYQQPVTLMLAYVVAHEMGHILLPAPAHTSSGLMKAEWNGDDIRRFTTGAALFSATQHRSMQLALDNALPTAK